MKKVEIDRWICYCIDRGWDVVDDCKDDDGNWTIMLRKMCGGGNYCIEMGVWRDSESGLLVGGVECSVFVSRVVGEVPYTMTFEMDCSVEKGMPCLSVIEMVGSAFYGFINERFPL